MPCHRTANGSQIEERSITIVNFELSTQRLWSGEFNRYITDTIKLQEKNITKENTSKRQTNVEIDYEQRNHVKHCFIML